MLSDFFKLSEIFLDKDVPYMGAVGLVGLVGFLGGTRNKQGLVAAAIVADSLHNRGWLGIRARSFRLGAGGGGERHSHQTKQSGKAEGLAIGLFGHAESIGETLLEGYCTKGLLGRKANGVERCW